jgi:Protein involved in formate dehydrogenase formation
VRFGPRGGPGEFGVRLDRAEHLVANSAGGQEPLRVLVAVLGHQRARAADPAVREAAEAAASDGVSIPARFPLLDLDVCSVALRDELASAVERLAGSTPLPLAEGGRHLMGLGAADQAAVIDPWLDDVSLVDPRLGFWLRVAAAPILELAARSMPPSAIGDWRGAACPVCGGPPQATAIAEETGEFMAGSPRSLICGRCATWWAYPRVVCPACGEEDPRHLDSYLPHDRRWVRIDICSTCQGYIKCFDLRQRGAVDVVPVVDDVATVALDVWAQQRGFTRATVSLAGV